MRLALIAMLYLLASFCMPTTATATDAAPRKGGSVTFALNKEPNNLVALATVADPTIIVSTKIHDSLVNLDKDGKPRPCLATSWSIAEDGKTVTFKLREGVKWHDGKDFTSKDVAFSLMALKQYNPRGKGSLSALEKVETPDAHTAVLHLSAPIPYLLTVLCGFESPIVPAHVYGNDAPSTHPNNSRPVGCGPFRLKEWKVGSHIVLEAFPDYWDKGKPYLDTIIYKVIADSAGVAVALETGEADLMPSGGIPQRDTDRLLKLPHLTKDDFGIVGITAGVIRIEFNLANKYFQNPKVRQAVAHAIDKEFIKKNLASNYAIVTDSILSPLLKPYYTDDVIKYPYDVKKSNQLLDEAGFKKDKDGIRFAVFHDPLPIGEVNIAIGNYLKPALKRVGIDVTVRSQDMAAYLKRVYTDRDFDFINNGMNTGPDPTIGAQRLYWSKNFIKGVPFSNGSGYNNQEVDSLLEAAAKETDQSKRVNQWHSIEKILSRDLPDIPLMTALRVLVYNKRVQNARISPASIYDNFAEVWVTQ
jgi:peptide/nickel transport system substrate-binding protein